jgi:hypothetical protein
MTSGNKFAFLVDKESNVQSDVETEVSPKQKSKEVTPVRAKKKPRSVSKEPTPLSPEPEPLAAESKKMGRPRGKRSDPEYEQITAYIRKETHLDIKANLLRDSTKRDFSELIQDLLDKYLSTQKSKNSKT